jgi:lipopolysaccharide transport protein LptA
MIWQKWARLVIAVGFVAFAVVVALGFRKGAAVEGGRVSPTDPKALVETSKGTHTRHSLSHEDVDIVFGHLTTYTDGSTRLDDVAFTTTRANGRQFRITGKEAKVANSETEYALTGDVRIEVSDGMIIRTERAAYTEKDGIVRAPGPVEVTRGRMSGTASGMTYDKATEVLTLLADVHVRTAPDERGAGAMDMTAPVVAFNRQDKTVFFQNGMKTVRGRQTIEADNGVARLSADEERLESFDLHGNARIRGAEGGVGGLRALNGHDISLKYGADGETIEHATVVGDALIQLAGERGQPGRQIGANFVDMSMAPDGATPTSLVANEGVQLTFPPEQGAPARTINAQHLAGRGDEEHGLTSARFDGSVYYREEGGGVQRRAKSEVLEVSLGPGLSSIDEARFSRAVRFEDQTMAATSAAARYVLAKGTLDLSSDASAAPPHAETEQISVDAPTISIALDGPVVDASGPVKSVVKQQKDDAAKKAGTKTPTMLRKDQDVIVTAATLAFDGNKSQVTYTGDVRLTQGDTTIKAQTIAIDDKTGNLTASGGTDNPVATTMIRDEEANGRKPERVTSIAKAADLKYDDAQRRLTYSGAAHMVGPAGDMTADKIDLYLKPSGDEIDRVEAFDKITLKEKSGRVTTGTQLTYTSADETYVVLGTPVRVLEACGRETTGRELTLYKANDRITVAGGQVARTQTVGPAVSCP